MLLWQPFWAHRLGKCCCGQRSGHIDFEHVAVAHVLGTSTLKMMLWLKFWAHRLWTCCCGLRSGYIDFANVAVANVLLISQLPSVTKIFADTESHIQLWTRKYVWYLVHRCCVFGCGMVHGHALSFAFLSKTETIRVRFGRAEENLLKKTWDGHTFKNSSDAFQTAKKDLYTLLRA